MGRLKSRVVNGFRVSREKVTEKGLGYVVYKNGMLKGFIPSSEILLEDWALTDEIMMKYIRKFCFIR